MVRIVASVVHDGGKKKTILAEEKNKERAWGLSRSLFRVKAVLQTSLPMLPWLASTHFAVVVQLLNLQVETW